MKRNEALEMVLAAAISYLADAPASYVQSQEGERLHLAIKMVREVLDEAH